MTTAKLAWSSAAMFALLLPLAFAQSVLENPWIYFTVNTLILWLVLFIILTFLGNSIGEKEKKILQIGALFVAMVLAWNFVGGSGFIWQVGTFASIFNLRFLVNMVILASVFFYTLSFFLGGEKLSSGQSKFGGWIIMFLLAGVIASKMPYYVWQGGTGKQLLEYLFGQYGILTVKDNRLFIFITCGVLFSWLFSYWKIGQEGSRISIVFAIIMAAYFAHKPNVMETSSLILLGEVISLIIICTEMYHKWGGGKAGFIGATIGFVLVHWVVMILFDEKAPITGSLGMSLSNLWYLPAGIGIIIFLVGMAWAARKSDRVSRLGRLSWDGVKKKINSITGWTNFRRRTPDGMEPHLFRENKLLLHLNANKIAAIELLTRMRKLVDEGITVSQQMNREMSVHTDLARLKQELREKRSGQNNGWNSANQEVVKLLNQFYQLSLEAVIASKVSLNTDALLSELRTIATNASSLASARIQAAHNQYIFRADAVGAHHVVRAYRNIILDLANPQGGGIFEKHYKFARPGAALLRGYGRGAVGAGTVNASDIEVTQFGEVVQDINTRKDQFGDVQGTQPYVRVAANDVIEYQNFASIATHIKNDIDRVIEHYRFGVFNPNSRTIQDYINALSKNIYPEMKDEQIGFSSSPSMQNPALDLRGLANPGKHEYWGRQAFSSAAPLLSSPFPAISSIGIRDYLLRRLEIDEMNTRLAEEFRQKHKWDTGSQTHPVGSSGGTQTQQQGQNP
jgi:hypothetical protein